MTNKLKPADNFIIDMWVFHYGSYDTCLGAYSDSPDIKILVTEDSDKNFIRGSFVANIMQYYPDVLERDYYFRGVRLGDGKWGKPYNYIQDVIKLQGIATIKSTTNTTKKVYTVKFIYEEDEDFGLTCYMDEEWCDFYSKGDRNISCVLSRSLLESTGGRLRCEIKDLEQAHLKSECFPLGIAPLMHLPEATCAPNPARGEFMSYEEFLNSNFEIDKDCERFDKTRAEILKSKSPLLASML